MTRTLFAGLVAAAVSGCLAYAAGNGPVIGMALAQGGARVDNAKVFGSATLFDGTRFQADGYSRLELKNGTRLDLGAGSRAQVFANRVALESGLTEVQSPSGFEIEARTLKINPTGGSAIARVRLDGGNSVLVTAVNAPVNVSNSKGTLVARVMPNLPMSFVPEAGAANSFSSTGCVVNKSSTALLVDDNKQVFQLSNADVRKAVGMRATVRGTINSSATPQKGATQVVNVSAILNETAGRQSCMLLASSIGATINPAGLALTTAAGEAPTTATAEAPASAPDPAPAPAPQAGGGGAGGGAAAGSAGSKGALVGGILAGAAGAGVAIGIAVSTGSSSSPQ
jgi:hypothetical protein